MENTNNSYEYNTKCNPFKGYVDLFCRTNSYSNDREPSKTKNFSRCKQSELLLAVREVE